MSYAQGSRDNMSIVLVAFSAAPKPIPEVVEREQKFEDYIQRRTFGMVHFWSIYILLSILFLQFMLIAEILKDEPNAEASQILRLLNDGEIPDLPPKSTLGSK